MNIHCIVLHFLDLLIALLSRVFMDTVHNTDTVNNFIPNISHRFGWSFAWDCNFNTLPTHGLVGNAISFLLLNIFVVKMSNLLRFISDAGQASESTHLAIPSQMERSTDCMCMASMAITLVVGGLPQLVRTKSIQFKQNNGKLPLITSTNCNEDIKICTAHFMWIIKGAQSTV